MTTKIASLLVRHEPIQRLYNSYTNSLYLVNRRYQRKLVWSLQDKERLIDTIAMGYPLPLFLFASTTHRGIPRNEIIDGLQRLNAIFSFIEQEYAYQGKYFDMKTMVESLSMLEGGNLIQKEPILERVVCEKIATYTVALSEFNNASETEIDEVFRRINSNGKYLSPQEVRSAGSVSEFANLVRRISSRIRGDITTSDTLPLSDITKISLCDTGDKGVIIDDVFWVKNRIYTREQIRESRDEEIVADLIAFILVREKARSASEILDDYYGLHRYSTGPGRMQEVQEELSKYGADYIENRFLEVHDQIESFLNNFDEQFSNLVLGAGATRAPRYYQCIFLAWYELLVCENKRLSNRLELRQKMNNIGQKLNISGGGKWAGQERFDLMQIAKTLISSCFEDDPNPDPTKVSWVKQFEALLNIAKTEQVCYDYKQGFMRLDNSKIFDESSFLEDMKTTTAFGNQGKNSVGYLIIGVSDTVETAERHKSISQMEYRECNGFYITGIEYEANCLQGSIDKYLLWIKQKINGLPINEDFRNMLLGNIQIVQYYDKTAILFKIKDIGKPVSFDDMFYIRKISSTELIKGDELQGLFARFL